MNLPPRIGWRIEEERKDAAGRTRLFIAVYVDRDFHRSMRAQVKWDGCVDVSFSENAELPEDPWTKPANSEDESNVHLCGIEQPLKALNELERVAAAAFPDEDAWSRINKRLDAEFRSLKGKVDRLMRVLASDKDRATMLRDLISGWCIRCGKAGVPCPCENDE